MYEVTIDDLLFTKDVRLEKKYFTIFQKQLLTERHFLTQIKMKIIILILPLTFSFWYISYGLDKNAEKCESFASVDLLQLSHCNVLKDNQKFLYVSCDMNCFARNSKLFLSQELYTVLVSVGYKSSHPVTSANESICLWMTNTTIQKFIKPYSTLRGTNFSLSDGIQRDISLILEGKVEIVFPNGFQRITAVARTGNLCNVSSPNFDVSAVDDERNTLCKVKIFGIRDMLFTSRWVRTSLPNPKHAKEIVYNITNAFFLDKATVPVVRIRFIQNLIRQKFILSFLGPFKILKFAFLRTNFDTITNSDFQRFSSLEELNLTGGAIHSIESHAFKSLTKLSILDLSHNKLRTIPSALYTGPLPNILYLTMESNVPTTKIFVVPIDFKTKSLLSILKLSKSPIYKLQTNSFLSFSSLQELHVDQCNIAYISVSAFRSLGMLSFLDLAGNNIQSLPEDVFRPLISLKHLNLSRNKIKKINTNQLYDLNNLTSLNLENNQITALLPFLPPNLQELNLRGNRIKQWIAKNFSQLHHLDLSSNHISVLTKEMRSALDSIDRVNLSINPYNCTPCSLYYLHSWLREPNAQSRNLHICSHPSNVVGKVALQLSSNPDDCLVKTVNITMVCMLILLNILVIVTLSCVGYNRRWKIRYFSLKLTSLVQNYKRSNTFSICKDYDAYVSYASSERKWLVNELLPQLEQGENPLNLCIPDRDFIAGKDIVQNIIEHIEKSRNVILVLSEVSLAEHWCIFEMHIAYQKLLEEVISGLVLVKVGDIAPESANKLLNYLIKTRTYLEWPSEEEAKPLFWERLKQFLSRFNDREKIFSQLV